MIFNQPPKLRSKKQKNNDLKCWLRWHRSQIDRNRRCYRTREKTSRLAIGAEPQRDSCSIRVLKRHCSCMDETARLVTISRLWNRYALLLKFFHANRPVLRIPISPWVSRSTCSLEPRLEFSPTEQLLRMCKFNLI
mgnify:CR=1 FL=1